MIYHDPVRFILERHNIDGAMLIHNAAPRIVDMAVPHKSNYTQQAYDRIMLAVAAAAMLINRHTRMTREEALRLLVQEVNDYLNDRSSSAFVTNIDIFRMYDAFVRIGESVMRAGITTHMPLESRKAAYGIELVAAVIGDKQTANRLSLINPRQIPDAIAFEAGAVWDRYAMIIDGWVTPWYHKMRTEVAAGGRAVLSTVWSYAGVTY